MVLGDGMLGQMMEPLQLSAVSFQPSAENKKPWALTGCAGRSPNVIKSFYMDTNELEKFNLNLQKKYALIRQKEQRWEEIFLKDAKTIIVAYGSMARIARSAVHALRGKGKKVGLIRPITLWPFPEKAFTKHLTSNTRYLAVEMSYGQMLEDVQLAVGKAKVDFLGRAGGGVPSEEDIIRRVNG